MLSQCWSDVMIRACFVLSLESPAESKESQSSIDPLNVSSYSITSLSLSLSLFSSCAPYWPNSVHLHRFPGLAEIVSSSCGALGCNHITATEMEWTTICPAVYVCSFWVTSSQTYKHPCEISHCSRLGLDIENRIY